MKKKGIFASLILLVATLTLGITSSYSAYTNSKNFSQDIISTPFEEDTLTATCYRVNGRTTTYYPGINQCLRDAENDSGADTIYIIPSLSVHGETSTWKKTQVLLSADSSSSTYTIKSGDTFILPYKGTSYDGRDPNISWSNFPPNWQAIDSSIGWQQSYMTCELVIDSGVTLNIEGTLNVGGQYGQSTDQLDQGYMIGNTSNTECYAQISMKKGSTLNVNSGATMTLYGYIKEFDETEGNHSNGLHIKSGATFNFPMTIHDWGSGYYQQHTYSTIFPFNVYEFPFSQVATTFYQGSTSNLRMVLDGTNCSYDNFISSSGTPFIYLGNNGKVTLDYNPNTGSSYRQTLTTTLGGKSESRLVTSTVCDAQLDYDIRSTTNITFRGDTTINNLSMSVGITVSSEDKDIPFSYKFKVKVVKDNGSASTLTIPSNVKIKAMPGSTFFVEEGCTVELQGALSFYDRFVQIARFNCMNNKVDIGYPAYYPSSATDDVVPGAELINNGTINVSGSLAGEIKTTNENGTAQLNYTSRSGFENSTTEVATWGDLTKAFDEETVPLFKTVKWTATGNINGSANSIFSSTNQLKFTSAGSGDNCYWKLDTSDNYGVPVTFTSANDNFLGSKFEATITSADGTTTKTFTVTDNTNHSSSFIMAEGETLSMRPVRGIDTNGITVTGASQDSSGNYIATDGMSVSVTIAPCYKLTIEVTGSESSDGSDTTFKLQARDNDEEIYDLTSSLITNTDYNKNANGEAYVSSLDQIVVSGSGVSDIKSFVGSSTTGTDRTLDNWFNPYESGATEIKITCSATYKVSGGGGCLLPDTLITMADGSYKKAIDVEAGDMVMVFDHETGSVSTAPVIFNYHSDEDTHNVDVLNLEFEDNEVGIVKEHGFFDLTLGEYAFINPTNYSDYIGHEFYSLDSSGSSSIKTLTNAYITNETTQYCAPLTYSTLNLVSGGMLSVFNEEPQGFVNYFEYDENLKYDEEKKSQDIEEFGLFTYDDFSQYVSLETFYAFNGQYLKISIGKGLMTWDELVYLMNKYQKYLN